MTITTVLARIDHENNAEVFWDAFREAVEQLDHNTELAGNCHQILQYDEVELLDSNAISEFMEFVTEMPGFSDGPAHAKDAILFEAE